MIFGVALLIFGPTKLPQLGRSIGQGVREFRKATRTLREEVSGDTSEASSPCHTWMKAATHRSLAV